MGNSRHQTFATEKLLNVEKNIQKVILFEQLKLIVYSESEMTRDHDDSQLCPAFSEEHCWHSSLLLHALLGKMQSELPSTLKLLPRPSFTPIQLQVYIILEPGFIQQAAHQI